MNEWHVYDWCKHNNAENMTLAEITEKLTSEGISVHSISEGVAEYICVYIRRQREGKAIGRSEVR